MTAWGFTKVAAARHKLTAVCKGQGGPLVPCRYCCKYRSLPGLEGHVLLPRPPPPCLVQVRQLFEELVVPFVTSHERVARVMLGDNKDWTKMTEEDIREQLWQVSVRYPDDRPAGWLAGGQGGMTAQDSHCCLPLKNATVRLSSFSSWTVQ